MRVTRGIERTFPRLFSETFRISKNEDFNSPYLKNENEFLKNSVETVFRASKSCDRDQLVSAFQLTFKINEWFDSSLGQSMVIQRLDAKRPTLSNPNQTQNKRRYVNFENGSHFICSLNLNSPELTIFIVFKITGIDSGDQEIVNSLIGNSVVDNGKLKINAKHISFYRTHSGGLGLLISKAQVGAYVAIANDGSNLFPEPDLKFPSSKSNCTVLNKWSVISVTCLIKKITQAIVGLMVLR